MKTYSDSRSHIRFLEMTESGELNCRSIASRTFRILFRVDSNCTSNFLCTHYIKFKPILGEDFGKILVFWRPSKFWQILAIPKLFCYKSRWYSRTYHRDL